MHRDGLTKQKHKCNTMSNADLFAKSNRSVKTYTKSDKVRVMGTAKQVIHIYRIGEGLTQDIGAVGYFLCGGNDEGKVDHNYIENAFHLNKAVANTEVLCKKCEEKLSPLQILAATEL